MNSKNGSSFDFDLGIGSNRSRSLNDQKNKSNNPNSNSNSNSYMSSSFSQPKPASTMPSWQPGKPSWTHQPAPSNSGLARSELGAPSSMVGDISGKSWNSTKPTTGTNIGVVPKNPNLFGDLVNSALGQNKGSSNVPLKNAAPVKGSFSMGGMANSLPKMNNNNSNSSSNVGKNSSNVGLGSSQSYGSFGGVANSGSSVFGNNGMTKSSSVGGNSMRNLGGGVGVGMSSNKDPFGSLVDFSSKPMGGGSLNSSSKATATATASTSLDDFGFGDFQNAPKSNASAFPSGKTTSSNIASASTSMDDFGFGDFQNIPKSNASAFPSGNTTSSNLFGSNSTSLPKMDSFATQNPAPAQPSGGDSFDMFFSSTTNSGGAAAASNSAVGGQQFSGGDDWGMDSEFGGGEHDGGSTTEIEGLPPPPAGVSAASAKAKGLDNYKQGQFADAIKWLSWAEVLIEKSGDAAGTMEVLTCRASCYKEVGEYKKAVADCSKILDRDGENVTVLVQRALLYESMEKYRLGADDLRTVMKIDPSNRLARSTIHRLNKMAD